MNPSESVKGLGLSLAHIAVLMRKRGAVAEADAYLDEARERGWTPLAPGAGSGTGARSPASVKICAEPPPC